jgi:predicted nucleic acid-binding protein
MADSIAISSLSSDDIAPLLRRNRPARWKQSIPRRQNDRLPFLTDRTPRTRLLLDTTVYIDGLQGLLPPRVEALLAGGVIFHSAVARAELALSIGHLDPDDPRTPNRRSALEEVLDRMRPSRRVVPSERAWTEAALLAGILSRTQGLAPEARRALLNDALMLMTAREHGLTLLSRNVADMDRLTALRPDVGLLLYGL